MKLNLRGLEGFRETMLNGSATAAAVRMGLTQSAVSRMIAQLEDELGFELFHREKGRLVPTPEALQLYEQVEIAFGAVERVGALVGDIAASNTGLLKIVAPPSLSEGVLSEILSRFTAKHPGVRLSIDSRSVETAKSLVANRTVDCGFAKLPLDRPDIRTELLSVSETVCVLPTSHRLAGETTLTPELLRGEPLILLGRGRWSRLQIEAAFKAAGVPMDVRVETHTVGSACALAAHGLGVAVVNELMARACLGPSVVARVFRPQILHEYAFITSALAPMSRLAAALLEEARAHLAQERGPGAKGPGRGDL